MKSFEWKKVGENLWLFETDTETGETRQTHFSERTFPSSQSREQDGKISKYSDLGQFISLNNLAIHAYKEVGAAFDEVYEHFLTYGFRTCQQLEGKVKERTLPHYQAAKERVESIIKQSYIDYHQTRRLNDLERMLSPEYVGAIPAEDRTTWKDMIDACIAYIPPDWTTFTKQGKTLAQKIEMYHQLFQETFPPLADEVLRLDPSVRVLFLELVKFKEINGDSRLPHAKKNMWSDFFQNSSDYKEIVEVLGYHDITTQKNIYQTLLSEMKRNEEDFYSFYNLIVNELDGRADSKISKERIPLFAELLLQAQAENIPNLREDLPERLASLPPSINDDAIRTRAKEAIRILNNNEGFRAAYAYLETIK